MAYHSHVSCDDSTWSIRRMEKIKMNKKNTEPNRDDQQKHLVSHDLFRNITRARQACKSPVTMLSNSISSIPKLMCPQTILVRHKNGRRKNNNNFIEGKMNTKHIQLPRVNPDKFMTLFFFAK